MIGVSRQPEPKSRDSVCAALCRVLADGVDIHRCMAAQALGRIGHPGAVESLVEALLDEDADVRTDAATALLRLADPRAIKPLLDNLLGDPCTDVKLAAIEALARMGHRDAIPWLKRLLKGRDEEIVWDVSELYETGWDDWADIQIAAVKALADLDAREAVPDIVEAIADEHGQDLTEIAFKALSRLGQAGIGALATYLDDPAERRRRRAGALLAGVDGPLAREAVARALKDPSREVRLAVARSLADKNPADDRLDPLFDDAEPEVRAETVRLCGRHHPSRIEALLDDADMRVQEAALVVLANVPGIPLTDAGLERIRTLLRGMDVNVAAAAARTLAAVAPQSAFDELTEQLIDDSRPLEVRLGAVGGLATLGDEMAPPVLAEVLGDEQRQLRLEAMAALAAIAGGNEHGSSRASEILLAALRGELVAEPEPAPDAAAPVEEAGETIAQENARDDEAAAEAEPAFPVSTLQAILNGDAPASGGAESPESSVELTAEDMERLALAARRSHRKIVPVIPKVAPYQDVRRFAARVLGDLARPEMAVELAEAITDDDRDIRLAAADSLARIAERMDAIPDAVVDVLLSATRDQDRDMRLATTRALGTAQGERAAGALIGRLGDEDGLVRAEAVRALSRMSRAGPEIIAHLGDPEPGVRVAAAKAVAAAGHPGAVTSLIEFAFAHGGQHRREAGRLLLNLDAEQACERFLDVLADPDQIRVWQVAIEALEEINLAEPDIGLGAAA